ncbi:MAG: T9SS type A sorting domain-containing protein, partial [Bacteroidota bacterium]
MGGQGTGPCTSAQEGELITPSIDLSGFGGAGVSLLFYQSVRHFTNSQYFVGWSTDGGNSWTEVPVNSDLVVNANTTNNSLRIPLVGVSNPSDLRVKFRYNANYYFWAIDDVLIIEQEANNLRVNGNFFAPPQNAQMPYGQQDPIYFLADVENIGAEEQTSVNLNVTITNDATNDVVFTSDLAFDDIPGNTLVENSLFDDIFVPDLPIGNYTGVYTVGASADDFDPSDNTQTFHFDVTETTFAKEFGPTRIITPASSNWDAGELHNWAYGNAFYIDGDDDLKATSISFSIANPDSLAGLGLQVALYFWEDVDGDNQADDNERTELGTELYGIVGDETATTLITVPFGDITPAPPALEFDGHYLVMVEWVGAEATTPTFWLQASGAIDYSAMAYTTDSIEVPRYASVLAIDATLDDEIYGLSGGLTFGADVVPVVRLNVTPVSSTNTPLSEENIVEVFPNPAGNVATLKVDFVKPQEHVYVQVLDAMGRVAFENTYDNVHKTMLPLDASRLATGTYSVHVMTEDGVRTTKLVVSK